MEDDGIEAEDGEGDEDRLGQGGVSDGHWHCAMCVYLQASSLHELSFILTTRTGRNAAVILVADVTVRMQCRMHHLSAPIAETLRGTCLPVLVGHIRTRLTIAIILALSSSRTITLPCSCFSATVTQLACFAGDISQITNQPVRFHRLGLRSASIISRLRPFIISLRRMVADAMKDDVVC